MQAVGGKGKGWAAVSVPQNRGPLQPHGLCRVSMDAETKPSRAEARSRGSTLSKPKGKQLFDLLDDKRQCTHLGRDTKDETNGRRHSSIVLLESEPGRVFFAMKPPRLHNILLIC
ncbi:hypothetical protein PspLS_08566 [Pyricularia sp. CBS 133598]|nr:hypothetical protein PspLS_08566 [Pyricularia sp. CBS 133598]